jgi:hypothetical protein
METWFTDPSKIGAYVLLLGIVAGFFTGKLVPGTTHDRVVKERDLYLQMLTRQSELLSRASISGVEIAKIASDSVTAALAAAKAGAATP